MLERYANDGSQEAFAELVRRHLNFVYSCALRQVRTRELAEDVTQIVFANLACKAGSMPREAVLAGWLHRDARFTALDLLRRERRRQHREQEAMAMNTPQPEPEPDWEQIRPWLDEVLDEMNDQDRDALLLRFFERRSLKEVGEALGSGEDAARKRVVRALDKLRDLLIRRGVTTSASVLSLTLAAKGVQVAPAGLAGAIAASSLATAGLAGSGRATLNLVKLMTTTQLKTTVLVLAAIAGITTGVVQHAAAVKVRSQNLNLLAQTRALAQLQLDNERLSNRVAQLARPALTDAETAELVRLRGEVGRLRTFLAAARPSATRTDEAGAGTGMSAGSAQIYTAALNASIPFGQTLISGGWATAGGKRIFVLVTPSPAPPDAGTTQAASDGSPPEQLGVPLKIKTDTIEIPEALLNQFGLDQFKATGQSSSVSGVLLAADAETLLKSLQSHSPEGVVISHGVTTLRDGMQSEISFGEDPPAAGQAATTQFTVGFTPKMAADQQTVNLSLNAQVSQPGASTSGK